jgi:hypothetical protein
MATEEAGEVLGNMLMHNSNLQELNVSNNSDILNSNGEWIRDCSYDGPGFAEGLSKGLSCNQALSVLNVARNGLCGICEYGQGKYNATGIVALSHAVKHNVRVTACAMSTFSASCAEYCCLPCQGEPIRVHLRWIFSRWHQPRIVQQGNYTECMHDRSGLP